MTTMYLFTRHPILPGQLEAAQKLGFDKLIQVEVEYVDQKQPWLAYAEAQVELEKGDGMVVVARRDTVEKINLWAALQSYRTFRVDSPPNLKGRTKLKVSEWQAMGVSEAAEAALRATNPKLFGQDKALSEEVIYGTPPYDFRAFIETTPQPKPIRVVVEDDMCHQMSFHFGPNGFESVDCNETYQTLNELSQLGWPQPYFVKKDGTLEAISFAMAEWIIKK